MVIKRADDNYGLILSMTHKDCSTSFFVHFLWIKRKIFGTVDHKIGPWGDRRHNFALNFVLEFQNICLHYSFFRKLHVFLFPLSQMWQWGVSWCFYWHSSKLPMSSRIPWGCQWITVAVGVDGLPTWFEVLVYGFFEEYAFSWSRRSLSI